MPEPVVCSGAWLFEKFGGLPPRIAIEACANATRNRGGTVAGMRPFVRNRGGITTISPAIVGLNATSSASRANAHALKVGGGGSVATGPRQSKIGDLGGIVGRQIGGETGEAIGRIGGEILRDIFGNDRPTAPISNDLAAPGGTNPCPGRMVRVRGSCVDLTALPPGGDPAIVPVPGTTVGGPGGSTTMGAFGLPAVVPAAETRIVRKCPRGMVLGMDDLCYPKAVLPRRSRNRKWRGDPKPPVTAADAKAIRRADRVRETVLDLAKDVGLHASKSKPRPRKK